MNCPQCSGVMDAGWLSLWNVVMGFRTRVRWQSDRPGYIRLRSPGGATTVLSGMLGGREARVAHRCRRCGTVVIPPDERYLDATR